jgi:hypothetical protein
VWSCLSPHARSKFYVKFPVKFYMARYWLWLSLLFGCVVVLVFRNKVIHRELEGNLVENHLREEVGILVP